MNTFKNYNNKTVQFDDLMATFMKNFNSNGSKINNIININTTTLTEHNDDDDEQNENEITMPYENRMASIMLTNSFAEDTGGSASDNDNNHNNHHI